MKKLFFLLAFPTFLTITANAQDSTESPKPQTGNVTTEVSLGLFNSGITINNIFNQLRGRYFLSPTTAVRLGVNADLNFWKDEPNQNNNTKTKIITFSISPGIEKHFSGTNRLSPYIGAEVAFVSHNFNQKEVITGSNPSTTEYKNGRTDGGSGYNTFGYTRTGLNAVAGADYYFAEHFYAGLEVGYGFAFTKNKDIEVLVNDVSTFKTEGSKNFTLGAYANNGIRIGFVF